MGKSRFHYDTSSGEYTRRIILKDNHIIDIFVPSNGWSRKTSVAINQWIMRIKHFNNKDINPDTFRWGRIEIKEQIDNTTKEGCDYRCSKCSKIYKSRSGLYRHLKSCSVESEDVSSVITTHENIRIISNPQYTNQNILINNNIQVRNFGEENPNWLTSQFLYQAISDVQKAIPKLMQKKHFNDDFPENKNIRIDNKRNINRMLQVFEGGRWCIKDSKHTFYRVLVDIYDVLSDALICDDAENDDETISEQVRQARRSERFLKKVEKIRPIWEDFEAKLQENDTTIMDDLWNDLKVLLMDRQLAIQQGFE